jgi:hypothetical protein
MKTNRRYKKRRTSKRTLKRKGGAVHSERERDTHMALLRRMNKKIVNDMDKKLHNYKNSLLYGNEKSVFYREEEPLANYKINLEKLIHLTDIDNEESRETANKEYSASYKEKLEFLLLPDIDKEILKKEQEEKFVNEVLKYTLIEEMFRLPLNDAGKFILLKLLLMKDGSFGYATPKMINDKKTTFKRLIELRLETDKPGLFSTPEYSKPDRSRLELKFKINKWLEEKTDEELSEFGIEMKNYFNANKNNSGFMLDPKIASDKRKQEIDKRRTEIYKRYRKMNEKISDKNDHWEKLAKKLRQYDYTHA